MRFKLPTDEWLVVAATFLFAIACIGVCMWLR